MLPRGLTIRTEMLAGFLLVALFSIFLVSFLAYRINSAAMRKTVLNDLALTAEITEDYVNSFLAHIKGRAVDFSSDGFIRDSAKAILARDPVAARALGAHLKKNKMSLDATIFGINVLDRSGRVIASTDEREIGADESGHDYFRAADAMPYGRAHLGDAMASHHFGTAASHVPVAAPLTDKTTGERLGVLVNYVLLDELNAVMTGRYKPAGFGADARGRRETLEMYLVDQSGFMITDSRFLPDVFLKQKVDIASVERCRMRQEMAGVYSTYRGASVVGVSSCLANGWTLVAEMETDEAFAALALLKKQVAVSAFFLLLAIAFFAFYVAGVLSRPLNLLRNVAEKIARGDILARIEISDNREVASLSASFNKMLDALEAMRNNLKYEKEKINTILNSLPVPVSIVDETRTIQYANKAFLRTFGGEAHGNKCFLRVKDDKKICAQCPLSHGTESLRQGGEVEVAGAGGGKTFVITHAVFEELPGKILVIETFHDVTREREIDLARSQFVSLASHELRGPLASWKWSLDALLGGKLGLLNERQKEYLAILQKGNQHLIDLVSDLLNVSRIEMGKEIVEIKPLDIAKVVEKTVSDYLPAMQKKNLRLEKTYGTDIPRFSADEKLLRIIFENLLSNAVKYTPESGYIRLVVQKRGGDIVIEVADTGCGISEGDKPKIFTRFFRGDAISREEGTGLGLYMVKSIVEQYGGKIWFESEGNSAGSSFFVSFPLSGMRLTRPDAR